MDAPQGDKPLKVKISTLRAINKPIASYLHRTDSLLKDHYSGDYTLRSDYLIPLLEMRLSAQILKERIEDLEDQSEEAGVLEVYLSSQEIQLIATLAHSLELGVISSIGNLSLREH